MERQTVNSSNISSIGYDEENEILEIEFKKGEIYQYFDVPYEVYDELMNAESHGKYLAANIKNVYKYEKK